MTFNISVFKGYISIWTDDGASMKRINPRLLNGQPATCVAYDNGKVRCAFKAGIISLMGKDFFVRVTDDGQSWVMMPSTPKATVDASTDATVKTAPVPAVKAQQKIALSTANTTAKKTAKKVSGGQVTLI